MGSSRGQIILVAALAIAVTLVALALVVNTAIYTENLATRETVDGSESIAFEQMVEESGAALLERVNRDNRTDGDYSSHVSAYRHDIRTLETFNQLHSASSGRITAVELTDVHNGTAIVQEDSLSAMDDDQGNSTWRLATNVQNSRRFVINVTSISNPPFVVNVTNSTSTWKMNVTNSGDYEIQTYTDGTLQGTCNASGSSVTIDVTNGLVNNSACSHLEFAEGVGKPYTITFEHASNTTGSYHLIVDRQRGDIKTTLSENYQDPGPDPALYTAIYNATLNASVKQPDLSYSTTVTVEPDGSSNTTS